MYTRTKFYAMCLDQFTAESFADEAHEVPAASLREAAILASEFESLNDGLRSTIMVSKHADGVDAKVFEVKQRVEVSYIAEEIK